MNLSTEQCDAFRAQLLKLRDDLESTAAQSKQSSEVVELDQARVGRLSRIDAMQGQAMAQATGRRRELTLRRIAAALAEIESGDYGICKTCDEPINPKRLAVDPTASLCVQCAEQAEPK